MIFMKTLRFFAFAGIALAAMSCNKIENPAANTADSTSEMRLTASLDLTRTVNNGDSSISWEIGDQMTVLYTGYCGYGSAPFTRIEGDIFMGCPAGARFDRNDWYAVYPCIEGPASPTNVAFTVPAAQVQSGNDSQTHIAGVNLPLYGSDKNVAVGTAPDLQMHHVASFLKFKVTNAEASPVIIKSISFSAPAAVAGQVTADLTADAIALTEAETVKSVELAVEDGAEIASGASASFYMSVLPFSCEGDFEIEVIAESAGRQIVSSKTVSKKMEIAAGSCNTLNYTFVNTSEKAYAEAASIEAGKSYIIVCGDNALANNAGAPAAYSLAGKLSEGKLYIPENDAESVEWTAGAAGFFGQFGDFTFSNAGSYIARIGDGNDIIVLSDKAGTRTAWSFDGDDLLQKATNHYGVSLFLGFNGGAWDAAAQSQTNSIKVYVAE